MTGVTGEQPGWKGGVEDCPDCRQVYVPTVGNAGWVIPFHPNPATKARCPMSGRGVPEREIRP